MQIVALLSFYAEQPATLQACVEGIHNVEADHLVAVDGPYDAYPDTTPRSSPDQYDALHVACEVAGLPLTLHTPTHPWAGNETEKRSFLMALGHAVARPYDDWLLVVDADEYLHAPDYQNPVEKNGGNSEPRSGRYKAQLYATTLDVGTIRLTHPTVPTQYEQYRRLYRAHPQGIRVGPTHMDYATGDGTLLMGYPPTALAPALHTPIMGTHTPHARTTERTHARHAYYHARKAQHIEG